jgi:outer membrane protein, adhesin transport system
MSGCVEKQAVKPEIAVSRSAQSKGGVERKALSADVPHQVQLNRLSLPDAVGIAIARHPDISRANAVIAQSASQVSIEKAAWYPTLQYNVRPGMTRSQGDGGGDSSATAGASVGINQPIYDFGRTASRISSAGATLEKQKFLLADTIEQVAYNTAATFVELTTSQASVGAAQRQVASLVETRAKIVERVKAGLSDASDLNQADIALEGARSEVLKAQNLFDVAAGKLAELSSVRPQRVASLEATNAFIARLPGKNGDIEKTPAVAAARAEIEVAAAQLQLARSQRFPTIGLGATTSVSAGDPNMNGRTNDSTFIGVTLNGSFSLGGLTKHQIAAAEAQKRAATEMLESQRLLTRTAVDSARTEASGAEARVGSYEKVISLSRTTRELYWQEYTLDKRPLTDVINADHDIYSSEVAEDQAISDRMLARIKASAATGSFVNELREQGSKGS